MNATAESSAGREDAAPRPAPTASSAGIDPRRYRKLRRFLAATFLQALWWELILRQPGLRRLRTPALPRWQEVTRRYRELAVEMGGVLIKLGQFLSIRVDLLPREITSILAGLQDEVPAAPTEAIRQAAEDDLGQPIGALFSSFAPRPLGSASLAQVHAATLASGEQVVVKVLRPGIETLVETDLAAIGLAVRWFKMWGAARRRVDLDRLADEFALTTRHELDLEREGRSAERLAADLTSDTAADWDLPAVAVPRIVWSASSRRVLTMENVTAIKISDRDALAAAGIAPAAVAASLFQLVLYQAFVTHFVHADPHPGNLFVRPLGPDTVSHSAAVPDTFAGGVPDTSAAEQAPPAERAFEIVYIDCGMMAEVPETLQAALREIVIAFGTRDPRRLVDAYVQAGVLLPGADLDRLYTAHEELFERLWGMGLGEMQQAAFAEAPQFLRRYWDLIVRTPIQMPVDLLFVGRAFGLVAGLATHLDPTFDPTTTLGSFAGRIARGELGGGSFVDGLLDLLRRVTGLPARAERALQRLERGEITVKAALAGDAAKAAAELQRSIRTLTRTVVAVGFLLAGVLAQALLGSAWGIPLLALSGLAFLRAAWR